MKIVTTHPIKLVLAAASIATVGIIAVAMLDTEVADYGVPVVLDDGVDTCVEGPGDRVYSPDPPAPPAPAPDDVVQPGVTIQT